MIYILKHLLLKPKMIFEYFSCFWKVFCFKKIHKNPKIFNPTFWRLTRESRVYSECFVSHWRVRVHVTRKTWKIFQNLGFRLFDYLIWRLSCELRVHPEVFATHWRMEVPVAKKTWKIFSKSGSRDFVDSIW